MKVTADAELVRTIDTYYNDVDVNGHINSIKYIEHVLDLFDIDFYKANRLKRLEVAYVAETYQGDKLSFYREEIAPLEYAMKVVKIKKETQETIEVCRILMNFVKD